MAQSKLKIITRAVFQMTAAGYELLEEDSYEHAGPVALAKSGGRPPAAPDYVGAAREQGAQNLEAIRAGAALNRVNQTNPYGSTTYSQDPNNPDRYTQNTSLSGNQQRILNQSEGNQIDLGKVAGLRLNQVGGQGDFNLQGLPGQVTNVQGSNLQGNVGAASPEQRMRAEQAVYDSATRQLDPQFSQREEQTRAALVNSGVREGSEAWNNEMGNLNRERESAYGDARDRATMAGGAEASRMLQDDLSRTGFSNQAESQRFAQGLQNAQLQNEGRATGVNERLTERDVPLREFMSLYGGNYASPFDPGAAPNAGTPQAGDVQGAVGQQYNAQSDIYNWNQQRNAQNTNQMLQLAALFAQ